MSEATRGDTSRRDIVDRRGALLLTGAGLSLIAVCYGLARFAYGLFVPVFEGEFALTPTVAGVIASGSYVSYCAAIVASTVLTPRYGARAVAAAAGLVAAAGTLAVALAPSAPVLAAGVVLAGASTGVASPPLAHAVARSMAEPRRNRAQTVINAGTGPGIAVAGPIALIAQEQWRAAWLAFAVLSLAAAVWVFRAVPAPPVHRSTRRASAIALLPRPLLPPGSARLMAAAALVGGASAAVWTFGRSLLVADGQLSSHASTIAWIALGALGVLGAAGGDLVRRLGARLAWLLVMVALAAATLLIALFPGQLVVAAFAMGLFGTAYIAVTGLLLLWGTWVYADAPVAGVGLAFLVLALGQAAASPLFGALIGLGGGPFAFVVAAVVAVGGAFVRPAISMARAGAH